MQHLQPNTTLQGGKYRIERVLGQGGFGITYLARNTVFDVNVAIKEFFMKDENDRDGSLVTMPNSTKTELFLGQKEKFKKEAKRMFTIKNEHIVAVHDLFEENGTAYYVMDYVDGENLSTRLKRTGQPMSEEEVSKILPQILDALQTVHDADIWHLDLKPANIMIDKAGNVKLIDFGASKQLNAQKGGATTSTAVSYTNGFAPREQMEQNYDKFGPWTDLYALGATLYNLLTNKRPPLPTDIDDDMSDDKHLALPMPNVSSKMKQLILWLMKTNRIQRPKAIQAVKDFVFYNNYKDNSSSLINRSEVANADESLIAGSDNSKAIRFSDEKSSFSEEAEDNENTIVADSSKENRTTKVYTSLNIESNEDCVAGLNTVDNKINQYTICPKCKGTGKILQKTISVFGIMEYESLCPLCKGNGHIEYSSNNEDGMLNRKTLILLIIAFLLVVIILLSKSYTYWS